MAKFKGWEQSELAAIRFLHHPETHYDSLIAIKDKLPKKSKLWSLLEKVDTSWWVKSWTALKPADRTEAITKAVVDYNMVLASARFMSHPDYQQFIAKTDLQQKNAMGFVDVDIHDEAKKFKCYKSKEEAEAIVCGLFNHAHAVVRYNSQTMIVQKYQDSKGNVNYSFSMVKDQRAYYSNVFVRYWVDENKTKLESAFDLWLKSPQRKSFSEVIFNPKQEYLSEKYLNLWDGFAINPHTAPEFDTVTSAALNEDHALSKILSHLFTVICKSRVSEYKYLLALLSQWVKEPHKKNGVAIVLKSAGRGTGKSTVGQILKRIFGHHWYQVQSVEQLVGKFNGAIANKVVIVAEEAFWGGSQQHAGKLRTMITDSTVTIEGKFKDVLNLDSYHRFIFFTNNDWVVPASVDERRFFVLNVSEDKKQNKAYFDDLYSAINDDVVIGQLIDYLMNYDYSEIDTRTALRTEEFFDQVEMSLPEEAKWWLDMLYNGEIVDPGNSMNIFHLQEDIRIPMSVCYNSYLEHAKGTPNYNKLTQKRFGEFFKEMIKMDGYVQMPSNGCHPRSKAYKMKSIEELKLIFTHKYGIKIH